jgi:nucleoside-diphosphate-sugar epimerase
MNNEPVIILSQQANAANIEVEPIVMEFMAAENPLILITGGEGFVGARLAKACAEQYRVIRLDQGPQSLEGDSIKCDLLDDRSVAAALSTVHERYGSHIASVIDLANYQESSGEVSEANQTLAIEGALRLLRGLRDFTVEQFVFATALNFAKPDRSETSERPGPSETEDGATEVPVAGLPAAGIPVDGSAVGAFADASTKTFAETEPPDSDQEAWDFPHHDLEVRIVQQALLHNPVGIPTVILRIASSYDETCHSIPIAQQISGIYEKRLESYFQSGDTDHGRPFIRIDDLADSILRVIELRNELESYEAFVIAEQDVMSHAELQEQIGELLHGAEWTTIRVPEIVAKAGAWAQETILGRDAAVRPAPAVVADQIDARYPFEIERTKKRLGWVPQHSLRDTLSKMVGSLIENPHRWYENNNLTPPEEAGVS